MKERSYRCLTCRDEGLLVVINPSFMREYRGSFEFDVSEGRGAVGVYDRMKRFWRYHPEFPRLGPINHTAICNCGGDRSEVLRAELAKFRRGERINREKKNTPPAAGQQWHPGLSPPWPGPVDSAIWEAISGFYNGRLF